MPKTAAPVPHVTEWIPTRKMSTSEQYRSAVRAFFSKRGDLNPTTVGRDELVEYCMGVGKAARPRTCSALNEFFEYLDDRKIIDKHPATGLAGRVRRALEIRDLRRQLCDGGMAESEADALRWRDIMLELASPAKRLPSTVAAATREWLNDELLQKISGVTSRSLNSVLDAKVLT